MTMKNFKLLCLLVILIGNLSCSKDETNKDEISEYAMTAKIDGVLYEMNNPFGTNEAQGSIYSYYPDEDYIMLQGRYGGATGSIEIDIWINRDDLKIGKYFVGLNTDAVTTHIDLIDNSNATFGNPIYENTVSGFISIESINTTDKTISGSFEFNTIDGETDTDPINFKINDGTFNYKYDVN